MNRMDMSALSIVSLAVVLWNVCVASDQTGEYKRSLSPPIPASITATPNSTSIALEWGSPQGSYVIVGYVIRYGQDLQRLQEIKITGIPIDTDCIVTDVEPDTFYIISIRAYNHHGEGPGQLTSVTTLPAVLVPGKPGSLSAKPSSESIAVTWTPPEGQVSFDGYILQYSRELPDIRNIRLNNYVHDFIITDLEPDTAYVISVRGFNDMDEGPARLLIQKTLTSGGGCEETFYDNGKTYRIVSQQKTWRGAQRACTKLEAGSLAEVTTGREHIFLKEAFQKHDKCSFGKCSEHSYWVGARQADQPRDTPKDERKFNWATAQTQVSLDFWHDGEPNDWRNENERCAQYAPGYWLGTPDVGYFMNDRRCNVKFCFVCEK